MDSSMAMILAGIGGLVIGFVLGRMRGGGQSEAPAAAEETIEWWKLRESLTGTQLQILEYLEAKRLATITDLQEKFSFIPDRELYYRLEQVVLMQFIQRGRDASDVIYTLNEDYSMTVESDKTVMLSE
jgi:F420-0:gamma-glutamyl ligase-like protein